MQFAHSRRTLFRHVFKGSYRAPRRTTGHYTVVIRVAKTTLCTAMKLTSSLLICTAIVLFFSQSHSAVGKSLTSNSIRDVMDKIFEKRMLTDKERPICFKNTQCRLFSQGKERFPNRMESI